MTSYKATLMLALSGAILASTVLPSEAITRLRADQNSCATVQAAIQQQGAVIVQYPSMRSPDVLLFDRYVANRSYCQLGQGAKFTSIPAADTQSCRVHECVASELEPED